jgi:hypothetical protein
MIEVRIVWNVRWMKKNISVHFLVIVNFEEHLLFSIDESMPASLLQN